MAARPVLAGPTLTADGEAFDLSDYPVSARIEALRFVSAPGVEIEGVFPCGWLVEARIDTEDGPWTQVRECGAPAVADARGWECFHGHSYVTMEARATEGWDYFDEDEFEAARTGAFRPVVNMVRA